MRILSRFLPAISMVAALSAPAHAVTLNEPEIDAIFAQTGFGPPPVDIYFLTQIKICRPQTSQRLFQL